MLSIIKNAVSLWFYFLIAAFFFISEVPSFAKSIVVSNDSANLSIQSAIDMAVKSDTVLILEGTYFESDIIVDKSISLIGEGDATIDGQQRGQVLTIKADSVLIEGLTIRGSAVSYVDDNSALLIENSHYCIIRDCQFFDNYFSIYLSQASHCIVENNKVTGSAESESNSGNGIHLWYCRYITIRNNITSRNRDGIYFEFVKNSMIQNNISHDNLRYGLHFMYSDSCNYISNQFISNGAGVAVMYTKYVDMVDNTFLKNQGTASYGLLLKEISDSKIVDNLFTKNTIGVYIESSNRLFVSENDFIENGWAVKIMSSSIDNNFSKNNFIANSFQVSTNSTNNSSIFDRNYWSDYKGYDLDRDGYGDIPFRPVSLFALEVEKRPPTLILLHSILIDLLTFTEKIVPTLTPETLMDEMPAMNRIL